MQKKIIIFSLFPIFLFSCADNTSSVNNDLTGNASAENKAIIQKEITGNGNLNSSYIAKYEIKTRNSSEFSSIFISNRNCTDNSYMMSITKDPKTSGKYTLNFVCLSNAIDIKPFKLVHRQTQEAQMDNQLLVMWNDIGNDFIVTGFLFKKPLSKKYTMVKVVFNFKDNDVVVTESKYNDTSSTVTERIEIARGTKKD